MPEKYVPPYLRKKLEEEKLEQERIKKEQERIKKEEEERIKNAPPPCKWNFKAALTKNNKEFNIPKKTVSHLNYDYTCLKCSKPVKREGLNKNGTNYCWYCHSKIIFKDANFDKEYYSSDEEVGSFMDKTQSQKMKEMYENYLYDQQNPDSYKHDDDDYNY